MSVNSLTRCSFRNVGSTSYRRGWVGLIALAGATVLPAARGFAGVTTYVGGAFGDWNTSSNWSSGVPNAATDALIDNGNAAAASSPTLQYPAAAHNLTLDAGDSLNVNYPGTLNVAGDLTVNGALHVSNTSFNSSPIATGVIVNGALVGSGSIQLDDSRGFGTLARIDLYRPSGTLAIGSNLTVSGAGQVAATDVVNGGTINGDVTISATNSITNNGLISDGGHGELVFNAPVVVNNGTISGSALFGFASASPTITNAGTIHVGFMSVVTRTHVVSTGTLDFDPAGGLLELDGTLDVAKGLTVPVNSELIGYGIVSGSVDVSGSIRGEYGGPGASSGISLTGNLKLEPGGYEQVVNFSGTSSTLVEVLGNLDLAAAGDRLVLPANPTVPGTYLVATYGTLNGAFDNVTPGYSVSYAVPGQIWVTATPEPTAAGLLALTGMIGLTRRRRVTGGRRRRGIGPRTGGEL